MKIAIDASKVAKDQFTGTEHYSFQLILALSRLDSQNDYILYSPKPISQKLGPLPKNFQIKVIPFPKLWSQIRLSFEILKKPKVDVWFFPAHTIPVMAPKNSVVTLHDLGFKYFPELYTPLERIYHNWCMNFSVNHAKEIIAVSEYTKKDLIKNYPKANASKINVIYHGYDKEIYRKLRPGEEEPAPIDSPYFFYIGRLEKKKNIIGLLDAFQLLNKEAGLEHKLVLAGKPGYGYEQISEKIASMPKLLQEKIIQPGYVKEDEVGRWLRHAEAFVFPSNFEGFGMPIIQAMACGTPVISANNTSLPEIVAKAGILVDMDKPFEMAAAMSKLIHNKRERFSLISVGRDRAAEFSWDKCAEQTLKVLMRANK